MENSFNMKTLDTQALKNLADSLSGGGGSAHILGVADISRFSEAPERMHPRNIFPECKSVIAIVQPIPRSTYRGITEGTYWPNYTYYSYNRLNTLFRPMVTYEIARFIEDHGFEAVPVYPGVAETYPNVPQPLVAGRPLPDIEINVRIAAVACGLGEIGWSKVFLHPVYGPRVRIGVILTDAVLAPDPLLPPGALCKRCMKCVPDCPGAAIPKPGEKPPVKIKIGDQEYEWGDVHMGRCTATHHGLNWRASPFMRRYFSGFDFDVTKTAISESLAYRIGYTFATAEWGREDGGEFPLNHLNPYERQILQHTSYFAICGAKGCIRACAEFQEKTKNITQHTFNTPIFPGPKWSLPPPAEDTTGGIVEKDLHRERFQDPDRNAGEWK